MKHDFALHPAQVTILRELLFRPDARFSDLNKTELTSDHFTFHVKQLMTAELVAKTDDRYALTAKGKEFANRFDSETPKLKMERQAKIGVAICCVRERNGETEYLLQQRLKQPYFGFWGFMTGKVKWGESVYETAKRELEEEMGLVADLELVSIKHKTDYDLHGNLLEDKFFFRFRGDNPRGELIADFEGGHNEWISESALATLENKFVDLDEGIAAIKRRELFFEEKTYAVDTY